MVTDSGRSRRSGGERRDARLHMHHGVFLPLLLVLIFLRKRERQGGICSKIGGVSRSSVAPQVTSIGEMLLRSHIYCTVASLCPLIDA